MKIKELKWLDNVSDGVIVASYCIVKVNSYIKMEFQISHDKVEDVYYLHSFGKGSIRRLQPDKFQTVEEAKTSAYGIYKNELIQIKKAVDSFLSENNR